jgi:hypothetical protein
MSLTKLKEIFMNIDELDEKETEMLNAYLDKINMTKGKINQNTNPEVIVKKLKLLQGCLLDKTNPKDHLKLDIGIL